MLSLLERRMRGYLIETFKIINRISNYDRHFFNIFSQTEIFFCGLILKANSTNQLDFFCW